MGKECEYCGLLVQGKGKYCDSACKQAAYRRRSADPSSRAAPSRAIETKRSAESIRTCEGCGLELLLTGLQAKKRYCSDTCRVKAWRARRVSPGAHPGNSPDSEPQSEMAKFFREVTRAAVAGLPIPEMPKSNPPSKPRGRLMDMDELADAYVPERIDTKSMPPYRGSSEGDMAEWFADLSAVYMARHGQAWRYEGGRLVVPSFNRYCVLMKKGRHYMGKLEEAKAHLIAYVETGITADPMNWM